MLDAELYLFDPLWYRIHHMLLHRLTTTRRLHLERLFVTGTLRGMKVSKDPSL
jgi:hypothetical protein